MREEVVRNEKEREDGDSEIWTRNRLVNKILILY